MVMMSFILLALSLDAASAFAPHNLGAVSSRLTTRSAFLRRQHVLFATPSPNDENEEEKEANPKVNPYADPNYPDLEFVNYDDPEYQAFGDDDEFYPSPSSNDSDQVEAEIEAMREDRRRKNDEYQFQTYFAEILKHGQEYKGEWTVYQTSTFLHDVPDDEKATGIRIPRLVKAARPIQVVSRAFKTGYDKDAPYDITAERICHDEVAVLDEMSSSAAPSSNRLSDELYAFEKQVMSKTYWPDQLSAFDFRGERGIMCVGNAYTICTAIPLTMDRQQQVSLGPFAEYRAEVGIDSDDKRFRIKFDYSVLTDPVNQDMEQPQRQPPPLHLKSMTVCRETLNDFADQSADDALFGLAGADGGLYDPPPITDEEQARKYMIVDLEGRATVLFPYIMDQEDGAYGGQGWVMSLDWTPSNDVRYQVDRKVTGGSKLLGLRTLELSSVRPEDVDEYRPRDGGQDMRQ